MKKSNIITIISLVLMFTGTLHAQIKDSEKSLFTNPIITVYGGYPEYFAADIGVDFLFPSSDNFPFAYGLYVIGGFGAGLDDLESFYDRISGGFSLQHDYVGLKLGAGVEFSLFTLFTYKPCLFAEAILSLWAFDFKIIYDFNPNSKYNMPYTFPTESPDIPNPKYYIGIDLWMCFAYFFK